MNRCIFAVVICVGLCAGAAAQKEFADVPKGHWAYGCVSSLAGKGFVMGFPDGTFGGKRVMTRYEFAVLVARTFPQAEKMTADFASAGPTRVPLLDADDLECLDRMVTEFTPELRLLQVNTEALHGALRRLRFAALAAAQRVTRPAVPPPFPDVPRGHWAYDAVCLVMDRGLLDLYPD